MQSKTHQTSTNLLHLPGVLIGFTLWLGMLGVLFSPVWIVGYQVIVK